MTKSKILDFADEPCKNKTKVDILFHLDSKIWVIASLYNQPTQMSFIIIVHNIKITFSQGVVQSFLLHCKYFLIYAAHVLQILALKHMAYTHYTSVT